MACKNFIKEVSVNKAVTQNLEIFYGGKSALRNTAYNGTQSFGIGFKGSQLSIGIGTMGIVYWSQILI